MNTKTHLLPGDPPEEFTDEQKETWWELVDSNPQLSIADRPHLKGLVVSLCSHRKLAGDLDLNNVKLASLLAALSKSIDSLTKILGLTTDQKVKNGLIVYEQEEPEADPDDEYF